MRLSKEQVLKVIESHQKHKDKLKSNLEQKKQETPANVNEVIELRKALEEIPDIREECIVAAEELLQKGEYPFNDEEVAEKIVFRTAVDDLISRDS